jgi:hypothetical protein
MGGRNVVGIVSSVLVSDTVVHEWDESNIGKGSFIGTINLSMVGEQALRATWRM